MHYIPSDHPAAPVAPASRRWARKTLGWAPGHFAWLGILTTVISGTSFADTAGSPRVLLISIDGLRADHLREPDRLQLKIPTLRRLLAEGTAAKEAIPVFPSSTYPGHVSIMTGNPPATHGIKVNEVFAPLTDDRGDYHWYHRMLKCPTIYDAFRAAGRTTAAITWPTTVEAPIDFNFPEYWVGGKFKDTVIEKSRSVATPGLIEAAEARFKFKLAFEHLEAHKNLIARHIVLAHRPDLLMMHYVDLDLKQHLNGPLAREVLDSLEAIDGWMAELLDSYREAGIDRNLITCVVSDHGFEAVDKEFCPNVPLREAGLLDYDESSKRLTGWRVKAWVSGGSAAIMLKDANDREGENKAREALVPYVSDKHGPVDRLINRDELGRLGAWPQAAFAINAAPGWAMGRAAAGPATRPSVLKGMHGQLPDRPDLAGIFVISGPGIPRGRWLDTIQLIDVAPTLASLAGVKMPQATGRSHAEWNR